jgi:hypothetical protein
MIETHDSADARRVEQALMADTRVQVRPAPCETCVSLRLDHDGWVATVPQQAGKTKSKESQKNATARNLEIGKRLQYVLNTTTLEPWGKPQPKKEVVTLRGQDRVVAVRSVLQGGLTVLVHAMVVLVCLVLGLSMGFHGYLWDAQRSAGSLEPWAMARTPPWALYGAQMARTIVLGMSIALLAVTPLLFIGPPLHWGIIFALLLALPALMLVNGLWGMLACVLFHHRQGRMFARFALSPLTLGVAWAVRIGFVWMAWRTMTPFLALNTFDTLQEHWYWLLGLAPALLVVAGVLSLLIKWRIGARREGLRRVAA